MRFPFRRVSLAGLRLSAGLFTFLQFATIVAASPVVAAFERFHSGKPNPSVEGGLLLLNELNCVACHAAPTAWAERLPGRDRISLAGVGSRLSASALLEFVRAPHQFKPGTTMPQTKEASEGGNEALAAYLTSLRGPPAKSYPAGNKERGQRLYGSLGCAACHAPTGGPSTYASVPLGLGAHYDRQALATFLQNPLATRPAGRMPAIEMSPREAADLAEFIGARDLPAPPAAEEALRTRGRGEFASRNCAACHDTGEGPSARAAKPLEQLRPDAGCLRAEPPASAPHYQLNAQQTQALVAALSAMRSAPQPEAPALRVAHRFEQLNCYACHEWRGRGGPETERAKSFTATDSAAESLGELGRLPPSLDTVGRKLTNLWLEKLLWGTGGGVRPYLSVRMPRFGRDAAADLPALLAEACRPENPLKIDTSGGQGHQRAPTGRALMSTATGGLGCVNCHGLKNQEPHGIRAINLTQTAVRVRPEYFKALLLDPQHIQPGTIMPPLFTGRAAAEKEVESIWTYLKELDQSPMLPEGLAIAGAFELKPSVEGRPIIFRTFLEGAGTQAVTVGTPSGANAAFDAFEVRWALIWHGRFVDAQQNWEERAMKPVRPLGDKIVTLSTLMPFARLESPGEPWPTSFGSRAGYSFKGYRIGDDGVPTFRYTCGGLEVEDTLWPTAEGNAFRHRAVVHGDGKDWFFRGLAPNAEPRRVEFKNGTAVLEETISL